uniref:Putative secreted protein n=1 Tax=Ixodes ricinus TaxID=34613 RepID=A0A6B0U665_IXORI
MMRPSVWFWWVSNSCSTPNVCMASSLVGAITRAPVPLRGMNLSLESSSTAGIRKASVLPLPVLAAATMSLPSSRCGMVLA